jgi:uncharacterized protein YegL
MNGEPIEAVKNGVQVLLSTLRQDPHAMETAYLSVITFDSTAQQLLPLTDLASMQMPDMKASGTTALGGALELVTQCIAREVKRTTAEEKGDWKPLVFLMTDGAPTDDWQKALATYKSTKVGLTVACAAGHGADTGILKQITDTVVSLDTADSTTIRAFFKWVSSSISTGSQKIEEGGKEISGASELPPPPPEINLL